MAKILQKFYKNIKRKKIVKKLMALYYQKKGYMTSVLGLPNSLMINICEYLSPLEKIRISQGCQHFQNLAK
jgi:hypothetical protein